MLSSWRRSTLSAYSVMSRTGLFALSARLRTGAASGSILSTRGCWIVFGSSGRTPLTLSRTSCAATSVSFSRTKLMATCEIPSEEVERSSSMPLIVLTASSILSVTSVSICSGAAPGCTVVTSTVGKSIFGKRSTPRRVNENAPMTDSDRMRTVAKTGRLTHRAANHCMALPLNLRAVDELRDVPGCDALAGLESLGDLHDVAGGLAGRHDAFFDAVAVDDEDARRAAGRHDRSRGHDDARRLRGLFDARGREEPGLELARRIRHHRFDRQRALVGLERRRHVADLALELAAGIRVDVEVDRRSDGHC